MGDVILLSFTSALNPTLLTATTVMLLLPKPERSMLGYWLGALTISIPLGLVIVFELQSSSLVSTTEHTLSPIADLVLAAVALAMAIALAKGVDRPFEERHAERREGKPPPRWERAMRKGSAKTTFVIGVMLTLPGASYLAALDRVSKLNYSTTVTVIIVVAFNLVMLILLETPLIAFRVAPERTPIAIARGKAWARGHGRSYAVWGFAIVAGLLAVKGVIGLAV